MSIHTPSAIVTLCEGGCYSTYPDGASYGAYPHNTADYDLIAERCGYGRGADARLAYCAEHEVFHHLVGAWFFGGGVSFVLWALAHGEPIKDRAAAVEEAVVMTCQRWVRAGERPIIGGIDWDRFKREALALLDG